MFEGEPIRSVRERVPLPESEVPDIDIEDIDEAREYISSLINEGTLPLITIPEMHLEELLTNGISFVPKQDLLSGKKFSFIAGTVGIDPYFPEDQKRYVLEIIDSKIHLEPRLTGKDSHFHGVVGFPNGVSPTSFRLLGKFSKGEWQTVNPANKNKKNSSLID
jgi:hypothetical protein